MTKIADKFTSLDTLTARDLMGPPGPVVRLEESLTELAERFLPGPSRHLIVVDGDGRAVGVLDPRHLATAHRFGADHDPQIRVKDLGFGQWDAVRPEDDLLTCARTLIQEDLDAVPVVSEDQHVLGLITAHDIARAVAGLPVGPQEV